MDEVIERCKASQNKEELKWLFKKLISVQPKVIIEIGSWRGWLLESFIEMFDPEIALGVELDKNNVDPKLLETMPDNFIIADSNSDECINKVKYQLNFKLVDFLFIDANHSYSAVKRDFELYSPLVRKGGIIAFHDVALKDNPYVEVYKLWDEIKKDYQCELFIGGEADTFGKGTGTGIIHI